MLDALRAASQNWLGRIILAVVMIVIIFSFGLWGVGYVFNSFGANKLARVGNVDIGIDAYREAYQHTLQNLQQQMQKAITNEEARQYGVDREVLIQLVSGALLDQQGKALGLAMSDKDLARLIVEDSRFKGISGKFDRFAFEGQVRNAGMTERRFTSELRHDYLRREQTGVLEQGLQVPHAMLEAMNRYVRETRSIDYFVLQPSAVGTIEAPSAEALKAYYDIRRDAYKTPEYRKIVVLSLTLATAAKSVSVSDAEARQRYDEVKAQRYEKPEMRKITQLLLPDAASADKAFAKIQAGTSFDQLVAESAPGQKVVDLGTVAKTELVEGAVADAAFALPEGGVSKPVKTQFGFALLRVEKIIPAHATSFEEAKPAIEKELGASKARQEIDKMRDEIEDKRASGKTLTEAAVGTPLTPRTIEAIDAKGQDKNQQAVPDLPDAQALLKAVFASDIGVDNEPIESRDGGFTWFEVVSIDPARQQTLDEVRPLVEAGWQNDERGKRLAEKAMDLVKKITGGEKLDALAAAQGNLDVKHESNVKRAGAPGLTPTAVAQIFNVMVGGAASAPIEGGGRMIFQVLDAVVPPIDSQSADFNTLVGQVKTAIANDIVTEYIDDLRRRLGVSVNQRALQTALGSATDR